ncbi:MAG: (d)CMP kinase [Lachnospiraceae bacterium]
MGYNIAIDGPAGAGKSTIAKRVAKKLGYIYVDTGAMYRAMAIHFLNQGLKPEETEQIVAACETANVTISYENGLQQVYLNQENITAKLRDEAVGNMASLSSAIPQVREKLLELQRGLAKKENVVMDGRDIGTHVLPFAQVKIYLTASIETRAQRRYLELQQKEEACDYDKIARDIQERDQRDMNRETAPLKQAEDAIYIDSSHMTLKEVTDAILKVCKMGCKS